MKSVFTFLAGLLLAHLLSATPASLPNGAEAFATYTEAEFLEELTRQEEKHKQRVSEESPFIVNQYPTVEEWKETTKQVEKIKQVHLLKEDGKVPNSSLYCIMVETQESEYETILITRYTVSTVK